MNKPLKVSIITVCLNSGDTIKKTIDSVRQQTYFLHIEYIIVDGASQDGTARLIQKYLDGNIKFISQPDNGIYDAMNKGLKLATGDIVYFLNANDTLYDKDVVEKIVKEFSSSEAQIIYGNVVMHTKKQSHPIVTDYRRPTLWYLLSHTICHQAIFTSKSLFERYGTFNLKYRIASDYDWFLKAVLKNNVKVKCTQNIIANFDLDGISNDPRYRTVTLQEYKNIQSEYYNQLILIAYTLSQGITKILYRMYSSLKQLR